MLATLYFLGRRPAYVARLVERQAPDDVRKADVQLGWLGSLESTAQQLARYADERPTLVDLRTARRFADEQTVELVVVVVAQQLGRHEVAPLVQRTRLGSAANVP